MQANGSLPHHQLNYVLPLNPYCGWELQIENIFKQFSLGFDMLQVIKIKLYK